VMKKFFKLYSILVFFTIASLAVFLVALYASSLSNFFIESNRYNITQRLIETSKRLSAQVKAEELDAFREAADMERPAYQALRRKLLYFAKDADIDHAFILRVENGKVQHIAGSCDSSQSHGVDLDAPTFDVELVPALASATAGLVTVSELGAYAPGQHGLRTCYAPISDRYGKLSTICGVAINDEEILRSRRQASILEIMEMASVFVVFTCGLVGFRKYRREALAAKTASIAKSRFLSRMSHEIRTPMNAIIGMSELAIREYGKPQVREHLATIRQAGNNLLAIINDILDFSKIESGSLQIINAPYEAASLFNDVLTIIQVKLQEKEKDVEFTADISPDIPGIITGDETRVRGILLNLLTNSVKYTEKGFIKFTANVRRESGNSIILTFEVSDSGLGIKPEDISRLFVDFYRTNDKHTSNIEGTGLGLSITNLLCRAMGGEVKVRSQYGTGSTFTATIRQTVMNGVSPMGPLSDYMTIHAEAWTTSFIAPDFNILIVDDNAANLKVAEGLLAPFRMKTETCLSGKKALSRVQARNYDLVLMDHMMPEMDGVETVTAIRALGGRFRELPIAALTANAVSGMKEMFLANGFDDFLGKPIEIPKLNELIERWVPVERRRDPGSEAKEARKEEPPESCFIGIEGLDAARGLVATGGTNAGYRDVLKFYRRDAQARIPFLNAPHAENDLKSFITHAHALKSASASIGATDLSEDAKSLEDAGRRGDMKLIRERVDGFRDRLTALTESLSLALGAGQEEEERGKTSNAEIFPILLDLKKALETEDVGTADDLLTELSGKPLDEETKDLVLLLSDLVLVSDFTEAGRVIGDFLKAAS